MDKVSVLRPDDALEPPALTSVDLSVGVNQLDEAILPAWHRDVRIQNPISHSRYLWLRKLVPLSCEADMVREAQAWILVSGSLCLRILVEERDEPGLEIPANTAMLMSSIARYLGMLAAVRDNEDLLMRLRGPYRYLRLRWHVLSV